MMEELRTLNSPSLTNIKNTSTSGAALTENKLETGKEKQLITQNNENKTILLGYDTQRHNIYMNRKEERTELCSNNYFIIQQN